MGSTVGLEDGIRLAARLRAVRAAKGDVHLRLGECAGKRCERSGGVAVRDEERGVQARDLDVYAVDGADTHLSASEALAADVRHGAGLALEVDVDGGGVE